MQSSPAGYRVDVCEARIQKQEEKEEGKKRRNRNNETKEKNKLVSKKV